jgi:hypothetical protein
VTISGNYFQAFNTPRHDHSSIYTSGVYTTISNNRFVGDTIYSAAIEVHGSQVTVTGNQIRGYYRGVNIVSSDTTFKGNGAGGAVFAACEHGRHVEVPTWQDRRPRKQRLTCLSLNDPVAPLPPRDTIGGRAAPMQPPSPARAHARR